MMNDNPFNEYLKILEQICAELEHLSEVAKQKTDAVRHSDLTVLDQVMRQEQAATLTFRGLEQKQNTLLHAMGLQGTTLSSLPEIFPPKMRLDAKQVVEKLQKQYQIYRNCSEVARNTLERSLHEIDQIVARSVQPADGPGYQAKDPDIPTGMKTDFRA